MVGFWRSTFENFFDSPEHGKLLGIVREKVRDGVFLRTIGKWQNAGVMKNGCVEHPGLGTPQGGVISPLLTVIYLHEVVDEWFHGNGVQSQQKATARLVRHADGMVMVFGQEYDAMRFYEGASEAIWQVRPVVVSRQDQAYRIPKAKSEQN